MQAVSPSTPCSEASCSRLDSPEQVSHGSFSAFSACCTRCTLLFCTISPSWRRMRRDRVSRLITQVDSTSTPRSDASRGDASFSRLDGAQHVSHGSFDLISAAFCWTCGHFHCNTTTTLCGDASSSRLDGAQQVSHGSFGTISAAFCWTCGHIHSNTTAVTT